MQTLKLEVTITLDDDIAEAKKEQLGLTDKDIEEQVIRELKYCQSPSGLMFEIEVERSK